MSYDAVIVGSGPNGLAAAITLAREGARVLLLEAKETIGGGMRTAELTLPGFKHDICSAIHPLGVASPFFKSLPLADYGLAWIQPELPLAHPFDGGTALALYRDMGRTAVQLERDQSAYQGLFAPIVDNWETFAATFLGPLSPPGDLIAAAQFGLRALWPAGGLARAVFRRPQSRALFAGLAAHSIMPLEWPATAAFGLVLGALAHVAGWPLPRGGSQSIADALGAYLRDLGGEIATSHEVTSLKELPPAQAVLLDVTPRQVLRIANDELPPGYRRRLGKYRYGPGIFKVDWALDGPIPWTSGECRRAGTVHLGASLEEIGRSERAVWRGAIARRPFVIVCQQSLFDATRAPAGKVTAWAYCHTPHGSTVDLSETIESQIERFAPGFRDLVLARHTMNTEDLQAYNANYIGGDINGGVQDLRQLFTRPVARRDPYSTPLKNLFICSSSTPPGGGVHGMCGYHAARSALDTVVVIGNK